MEQAWVARPKAVAAATGVAVSRQREWVMLHPLNSLASSRTS